MCQCWTSMKPEIVLSWARYHIAQGPTKHVAGLRCSGNVSHTASTAAAAIDKCTAPELGQYMAFLLLGGTAAAAGSPRRVSSILEAIATLSGWQVLHACADAVAQAAERCQSALILYSTRPIQSWRQQQVPLAS